VARGRTNSSNAIIMKSISIL
jgi:hypothetical protein